jgi:hypothetical protein
VTAGNEDGRMTTQTADRTGVLIVRLWIEGNPHDGFRARITQTLDSTDDEQTMSTAANPDDLCAVVRTWVDAFVNSEGVRVESFPTNGEKLS